jgi:predicted permease
VPFWYVRRPPQAVKSEVDEELSVHLELRAEELVRAGMSPEAARREAIRQFGDLDATRRYCRRQDEAKEERVQRGLLFQDLGQDLRICLRGLLRAPLLALTIVLTVGLGIGATGVMFAVVHALLLRPLPYPDSGRLVRILNESPPNRWSFSVADYLALQEQQTRFERVAAYSGRPMAWSDGKLAERLPGLVVSWTYFGLLGIKPSLGRDFAAEDGKPGAPPVVLVSQGFWRQRLGGRPDAIGTPVRLDGVDYALVGVLPETPGPLEQRQDFFVAAQWGTPPRKGPFFLGALGRLRSEAERPAAEAELKAIAKRLFPVWQASFQDEKAYWGMVDLKTRVVGDAGGSAKLALAAVALVWLIACANASNLLIARVTSRRRELAVRAALGASRGRAVRHLLAESGLLAAGAAAFGIALAWAGCRLIRAFAPGALARAQEVRLDEPAALGLLAAVTLASMLLFGLVPALQGTGGPVDEALRAAGRSSTGSVAVRRLRRMLVASQFAIATPLLVVAGLLLASLSRLGRVDLGFDGRNLVSGSILLPLAQYEEPGGITAFWDELRRRVEAIPGIAGLAFADSRPPDDPAQGNNFVLEPSPASPEPIEAATPWVSVTPEYFRVLGLTLVQGRLFDDRDGRDGPPSVIVDRAWAKRFFPRESALGKRFRQGGCPRCAWTTVVGVVNDVKYDGLAAEDQGVVYWPMAGRGEHPMERLTARFRYLIVRTSGDPAPVLRAVRQVVSDLDPSLPFSGVATIDRLVADSLQRPRSLSFLVGAFAVVALVLSVVGIYGVMAHYVQQHSKDIAIRLALGGSAREVLQLVVGQGMLVVAGGVAVGLLAALAATRTISGLLFGVAATDAFTFAGVSLLLATVALLACCVPAGRAVAVQPALVLRNE